MHPPRPAVAMDWEAFYARFREPDFVPGYEIQNRLGGGAFGEVYKARKASIGKSFAIKFLKIDDDAQRDAALRELEQVRHFAALDHPNLVSIEDMGTAMDVPYLIMGYAGEDTLSRRLKHGPLDEESALLFFVQACRGVLALHDRRLVHFDLKPSNVFLKGDVARVGDYGLSRMMADGRATLSFGRGTPQYMAPEMLRNRADHRADIYSLGVILFECLTGKLPFESPFPGALALRDDDAPPAFPDAVAPRLRPVIERCLRVSPDDRYANVAEILTALGHTARLGDSVRVGAASAGPPAVRGADPGPATPRSEARQTAAELTRGAVEVARGVWDGLRSGKDARGATAPTAPPAPPKALPAAAPLPASPAGSARRAADDVFEAHTLAEQLPAPRPAVEGAATIPVPPPVRGGWLGTLGSTAHLALEVLVSLGRWLWSAGRRVLVRGGASAGRRGFGLLAGLARLVLFALMLALLGGLTTLLAWAFLNA